MFTARFGRAAALPAKTSPQSELVQPRKTPTNNIAMIKVGDPNCILNINYFVIYIALTPEEREHYGDKLSGLNRLKALTRGLYKYKVVTKSKSPHNRLPDYIKDELCKHNVYVRIIDDRHGESCYGFESLDLTLDRETLCKQLQKFVVEVCTQNILQLNRIYSGQTETAVVAKRKFRALGVSTEQLRDARAEFNDRFNAEPEAASDRLVGSALGDGSNAIDVSMQGRSKPERCTKVTATITRVPTGRLRRNASSPRTKIGIRFDVDGQTVYVPCGDVRQMTLFAAILLAKKEDKDISRSDFRYNELRNPLTSPKMQHICKVYTAMSYFCSPDREVPFKEWLEKIGGSGNSRGKCHGIDDAKSKINKAIKEAFISTNANGCDYCRVKTQTASSGQSSHYTVGIRRADISFDPDVQERFDAYEAANPTCVTVRIKAGLRVGSSPSMRPRKVVESAINDNDQLLFSAMSNALQE